MGEALIARSRTLLLALLIAGTFNLAGLTAEAALTGSASNWRCLAYYHLRQCDPDATASPAPIRASEATGEIALVNQDRAAAGLPALTESADLDRIATTRAQDMAVNGYFSHYRPGSTTLAVLELLQANHIPFVWYGENIAWESGYPQDTLLTFFNTSWMNSPPHRDNILGTRYHLAGVGTATSGTRVYMVEIFTN